METTDILKLAKMLAEKHPWPVVALFAIGLLIRLMKSDTTIPIDIPPRYRIWVALGLGLVSAVLERLVLKTPMGEALAGGFASWIGAVMTQNVVIDSLRGGKEIVIPGLIKPGVPPGPGKPPSIPPPPDVSTPEESAAKKEP